MKKRIVILLVVLVVTIGLCVGSYFLFTNDDLEHAPSILKELPALKEYIKLVYKPRVDVSLAT